MTRRAKRRAARKSAASAPAPAHVLVSQAEASRKLGISRQAVHRAVKTGRLTLHHGKLDLADLAREWIANTDLRKPKNRVTGDPHLKKGVAPGTGNGAGADLDAAALALARSLTAANARKATLDAELRQFELDEKRKLYELKSDVRATNQELGRILLATLLAMADRLPADLGLPDLEEGRRRIRGEVLRALGELKKDRGFRAALELGKAEED